MPTRDVALYEAHYLPGQLLANPGFIELRQRNERPELRELQFFERIYLDQLYLEHDLTGLFSPRFGEKTGLKVSDVLRFVDAHPSGEVFTFNAVPQAPYYAYNIWMHGEFAHPGILPVAQALMDASGIEMDLSAVGRHGPDVWCFSNFWLGSRAFWEAYVGGIMQPLLSFVSRYPDHPAVEAAMAITYHDPPTPFLPFIVERLFNTFLSYKPEWRSKVRAFKLDPAEKRARTLDFDLDVVSSMRERIDLADREGEFSDQLISFMGVLSRLRMRHTLAYYRSHPHPNIGRVLDEATIETGNERLTKIPIWKVR